MECIDRTTWAGVGVQNTISCGQYKNLGAEESDTSSPSLDTANPSDTGPTDTPDEAIVETGTEPSTEPVEEGGLRSRLETDVGYNPDSDLTSN